MKPLTMMTECLSYEQLQAYTAHSNKAGHTRLYMHISTCELCACAVNGFAALPFVSDDIVAIHREIDVRTKAAPASPLTFAQVCIVIVSLFSIFCFYRITNGIPVDKTGATWIQYTPITAMPKEKTGTGFSENKAGAVQPIAKRIKTSQPLQAKVLLPVEKMTSIDVRLPEITSTNNPGDELTEPAGWDVIYIYDLKVTDYSLLYFKNASDKTGLRNYTPPSRENKEAPAFENDAGQQFAAHSILKKGLGYLNKGRYSKAIAQFQLLSEHNPQDVNALFYSGTALFQLEKLNAALAYFEAVLQNTNTVFHPEAKWQKALTLGKMGNKEASRLILAEIVNENGFYSKQAKELLK